MGIKVGTKQNIGTTTKEIESWLKSAKAGQDLRAAKGLYLRQTAGGAFWFFRSKSPINGRQLRIPLWGDDSGDVKAYPKATLKEAQIRASLLRAQIDGGVDPLVRAQVEKEANIQAAAQEKLQAEADMKASETAKMQAELMLQRRLSVRQVFERWAATELAPHVGGDGKRIGRKDAGRYVREQFERRVFLSLGATPITEVKKSDVMAILDAAKAQGKLRTANVLLADLKQMFRFAQEREIIEHSPIELVRKRKVGGKDVKRNRFLSNDELADLVKALPGASLSKRTEIGLWLILATGCRIGELMGTVWKDEVHDQGALQLVIDVHNDKQKSGAVQLGFVDLTSRIWYMPTTKNQRDHSIHLSDFAVEMFLALKALSEVRRNSLELTPWIFPNTNGTGPVCIKSFGKQLSDRQRNLDKRLQNRSMAVNSLVLPGGRWTAHDLRRTASTIMSQLGVSEDVINECQNHVKPGMSGVYNQDRREAQQAWAFDALGAKLKSIATYKFAT